MRTEPHRPSWNDLHFHNGGTCHGAPTLKACVDEALKKGWIGKVLERTDVNASGTTVKCYSLIAGEFEHWSRHGKYVAEVKLMCVVL